MIKRIEKPRWQQRRQSAVIDKEEMIKLLKQSESASYIKDKLSSYFAEPSEFEKLR